MKALQSSDPAAMALHLDPGFRCRLCGARPFVCEHDGPHGPEWGGRSRDPGAADGAFLEFVTPDFCRNCDDVLDSCYALDRMPGHRFQTCEGKLALIQAIEQSPEMLEEFATRKVTYNSVLVRAARARHDVRERGRHVFLQTLTRTREQGNVYDWWPRQAYIDKYGDPDQNKLGHTRMKHNGKDGVAIFYAPSGVIRVVPETVSVAGQATTLAATAAGLEYFPGEMDASWREASKGSELQASQIEAARKMTKSPETFASDADLQGLAQKVTVQVGALVKNLLTERTVSDGAGTIDDHVSVVTGVGGQGGAEGMGPQEAIADDAAMYEQGAGAGGARSIMQAAIQERNRLLGLPSAVPKRPPPRKAGSKAGGTASTGPPPAPSAASKATGVAAVATTPTNDTRHVVLSLLARASPQTWLPAFTSLLKEQPDRAVAAWDDCYVHQVVRRGLESADMGGGLGRD